ncbi:MAG: hypothetical protein F6J90_38070 [Moorea sp. SIOASIH]|uniref:hypothetical protein n=1 Tax=Moorena sp. SIOASIH TaxID=2607817 RepID=UPI0013BBF41F|nr:hypothetical protein [Moorena sp. SIOASIH]NEO41823.1 hypothetical protein [Moorena sp. SIOASIH]
MRFIFVQVLTLGGENPQPVNLISAIDLGKATLRKWSRYAMLELLRDRISLPHLNSSPCSLFPIPCSLQK